MSEEPRNIYVGEWPVTAGRIDDYLRAWDGVPDHKRPFITLLMEWCRDRLKEEYTEESLEPPSAPWVVSPRKSGTPIRPGYCNPATGRPDDLSHVPVCGYSTDPVKGCQPCHGEEDVVIDMVEHENSFPPPEPPDDWEEEEVEPISLADVVKETIRKHETDPLDDLWG